MLFRSTTAAYTYLGKLTLEYQESIFYPYVGYIDAENECVKNKYDDTILVNNKSVTSSNGLGDLANKRYISNNFVLHYTNYRGALWSSSERSGSAQALHYSYMESQNKVTLNKDGSKYQEKLIFSSWKDKTKTFPLTLTDGTYTDAFYDAISNPHGYTRSSESYKKADARPVRCVVEE